MHTTLISAAELAEHLGDPKWVVVDCRFDLARPASGREAYAAGHIPGARYAHLDEDLSSKITPQSGRHPLPDAHAMAATLGGLGIDNRTQVVAYDGGNGAYAARLWWLMRWLGAESVAVLDGGFKAWTEEALPVTTALPTVMASSFVAKPRNEMLLDATAVGQRATDPSWRVLDARAPERYAGMVEPLDTKAGHVPGAHNYPFTGNLGPDGRFLPAAQLRVQLQQSLGAAPAEHAVMMCGSGVTACHNLLALEVAGLAGARLYAGSWSEWIRNPARPIALGPTP
ncbi:MAG: sulfurtransferase [Steroidobacteraceae bacterium]